MARRLRRCTKCKKQKKPTEYHRDRQKPGGLRLWCKRCVRDRSYERRYGITGDEYRARLEAQRGLCGICGTDQGKGNGNRMAVDHDHKTGTVRGLLCAHCNVALGYFEDDPKRLRAAIAYLRGRK